MGDLFPVQHAYLIPLLPLLAAAVLGLFGARVLRGRSHWLIWGSVGASAVLSLWMLVATMSLGQGTMKATYAMSDFALVANPSYFTWFAVDGFKVTAGFWLDPLSITMLSVVTGVGFLITVFAAGYMKGETGYWRFFAAIGIFIFAMTVLVMADNLVLLYLGWEGVGLASYLLIGFYSDTVAAKQAAKKAFIVNRIGDCGLAIAIILIYMLFGTVSFFGTAAEPGFLSQITSMAASGAEFEGWESTAFHWIPYLLLLGCFGKSAQWPLFTWLPDAMAGPTPVSALIHAATMVTAGVYLVVRCGPLFYLFSDVLLVLGVVGCFTAVFAGTISLRQYDLKKDFAYSTVSQLGFMFVAAAALAPVATIFHLITHAFFKALLFLGSGVVMHATHGELDMRKMSGLKRYLPVTRWLMLIGCAALAGLPLLSGYFSKDEILANSFKHSVFLGGMMLLSAAMTAYYTFRLYFRVFEGPEIIPQRVGHGVGHGVGQGGDHGGGHVGGHGVSVSKAATARLDHHKDEWEKSHGAVQPGMSAPPEGEVVDEHSAHGGHHGGPREPLVMILPLIVLAIGALAAGFLNFPQRDSWSLGQYLGQSPSLYYGYQSAKTEFGGKNRDGSEYLLDGKALTRDQVETDGAMIVPHGAFGQVGRNLPEVHGGMPHWVMYVVSGAIALAGMGLAYQFHLKDRAALGRLSQRLPGLVRVLEAKYWVDEIYDKLFVKPMWALARVADVFDMIVNALVFVVAYVPKVGAYGISLATQRGLVQGYAVVMLIGLAVMLLVIFR